MSNVSNEGLQKWNNRGFLFKLLETQMVTPVTSLFGAEYYPASEYLTYLKEFRGEPLSTEQLRAGLSSKMP